MTKYKPTDKGNFVKNLNLAFLPFVRICQHCIISGCGVLYVLYTFCQYKITFETTLGRALLDSLLLIPTFQRIFDAQLLPSIEYIIRWTWHHQLRHIWVFMYVRFIGTWVPIINLYVAIENYILVCVLWWVCMVEPRSLLLQPLRESRRWTVPKWF